MVCKFIDPESDTGFTAIFNYELSKYQPLQRDSLRKQAVKSAVPPWIHLAGSNSGDSLFFIGVSDPGLTDTLAKPQAICRAISLAALSARCRGSYLADRFDQSGEQHDGSRFEELYRFTASANGEAGHYRLVRDTMLKSGEMIVLLAINRKDVGIIHKSSGNGNVTEGFLYNYESDFKGKHVLERRIESNIHLSDNVLNDRAGDSLSFYRVNKCFTGIRNGQGSISRFADRYECYYKSCGHNTKAARIKKIPGSDCRNGLWIAILDQVYEQLCLYLKARVNRTREVADQSPDTRKGIIREENSLNMNLRTDAIHLSGNLLIMPITIDHEKE